LTIRQENGKIVAGWSQVPDPLFARSCLPAQAGYRSLAAVAYLRSGTPAQVSADSESAAPESAYTIVLGKTDGYSAREGLQTYIVCLIFIGCCAPLPANMKVGPKIAAHRDGRLNFFLSLWLRQNILAQPCRPVRTGAGQQQIMPEKPLSRLHTLLLLFAAAALFSLPATAGAETLEEAVRTVLATHPDVLAAGYNRLARDQEVRQARAGYFPALDLTAGVGRDHVDRPFDDDLTPREVTLSLRQNVFTGLATMNEVERQEARVRSQAYMVRNAADNMALRTARAYIDVLRYRALLELARENLTIHQRIADQIGLRSRSGIDRKADMDQIRSRLNLAHANVVVAGQNLVDATTAYAAVVGYRPRDLTRPVIDNALMPASLEEARRQALARHPALRSAHADLRARRAQEKVARSPFMPVIDIEIDQVYEDETNYSYQERQDLRAMLRLRYNLFHGWQDQARKLETRHLVSEAREIRNHTRRQVEESIRLSWMAYQALAGRLPYLRQRQEYATVTARAYGKQWNISRRTLLDVLDSEAERIDAIREYVNAVHDEIYARCRVLNGTGRLVRALGLEWPREGRLDRENGNGKDRP